MGYFVIEDLMSDSDIGEYISYGVELRKGKCVIKRIRDIDTDKKRVETLCFLCNKLKLSEVHLEEVIDDYLAR